MVHPYQQIEITTASPEMLVVKMYEGAIRFARRAADHHRSGEIKARGQALSRALAIVSELEHALDFEQGGEVARNLQSLYQFVNQRLVDANLQGDPKPIEEAVAILDRLLGAWQEIAKGAAGPTAVRR